MTLETDTIATSVMSIAEMRALNDFKDLQAAVGQGADTRTTIIGVRHDRLEELLPSAAELALLTHVRQKVVAGKLSADELAVIIGNQLPKAGRTSTVYLVSVAGRYKAGSFDFSSAPKAGDTVHLVVLKSWRFACVQDGPGFAELVKRLNRAPEALRLSSLGKPSVDPYLERGYVALPHRLRQGEHTVSWYHGPLSPVALAQNIPAPGQDGLPVRAADALLRIDEANGMIDVSYAAAWELGRLLALQSKRFSTGLYIWRRAHRRAHERRKAEQSTPVPLPGADNAADQQIPDVLEDWLAQLNRLAGVPFNYLVPDEGMLPAESIRFFQLDWRWMRSLLDGALSLGRVTEGDHNYDCEHLAHLGADRYPSASGFMMRSALVSGWPGMLIDAYDTAIPDGGDISGLKPLARLRMDRLSENVLLCLFDGKVRTVHVHLLPETLHFGVDHDPQAATGYAKLLRGSDGKLKTGTRVEVSWRTLSAGKTTRTVEQVIDIAALAAGIERGITSARFAKEMIEGISSVLLCDTR
jgi:hypothetical protein